MEKRIDTYCKIAVCKNGHAIEIAGTDEDLTSVKCSNCGHWTLDSNYCTYCGSLLINTGSVGKFSKN